MALKPVVADIAEVPEALRPLYVAKDGKHVLDIEGDLAGQLAAANGRIVTFRDTNVALLAAVGASTPEEGLAKLAKLKDVDPEEYARLKATAAKVGAGTPDEAEAKLKELIAAALAPVVANNTALKAELDGARNAANDAALKNIVGAAFVKAGGKADAIDFIVGRAKESFVVDGGVVKAKPNLFSADKPGDSLGVDEWLAGQTKVVGFAFEASAGGGATGGGTTTGTSRPGARKIVNPTPEELGRLQFVAGKGLVDSNGQVVEIANA